MLPFSYTIVITSNLTIYLLQYKHNIPNTAPVHQKCTKDLNTQRCNKKKRWEHLLSTHITHFTTIFTNQFWFELVFTVPMSKSPVSTLSPGVDISMAGDGCWMGSSTCNVYNLLASQGLYYPWTLTRTGNKYIPFLHYATRKQTQYDIISVRFINKRHLGMALYQHPTTTWDNTWMPLLSKACRSYMHSNVACRVWWGDRPVGGGLKCVF